MIGRRTLAATLTVSTLIVSSLIVASLIASSLLSHPAGAMVGGAAPAGDGIARSLVMVVGSRSNGGSVCTGAALARDLILTAAHCVAPGATYSVFPARNTSALAIKSIQVHPRYDPQSYALNRATADVALIKLAVALPERFVPVALEPAGAAVAVGDRFTIAGFGVTAAGSAAGSDNGIGLARAAALVATGQPGALQIRLFDPATKGDRPGLGACTGDSGAPVLRDVDGQLMVIGVVSWSTGPKLGAGCGGLTGVTPLVRYRDWIVQAAGKLGSPVTP
jgi:secreted trypsin-like serine protease